MSARTARTARTVSATTTRSTIANSVVRQADAAACSANLTSTSVATLATSTQLERAIGECHGGAYSDDRERASAGATAFTSQAATTTAATTSSGLQCVAAQLIGSTATAATLTGCAVTTVTPQRTNITSGSAQLAKSRSRLAGRSYCSGLAHRAGSACLTRRLTRASGATHFHRAARNPLVTIHGVKGVPPFTTTATHVARRT